ncbi:MAG: hypothetical protein MPN21_18345 [Thermoanaerobaculia bacterium]|nr:hypothetical protein [Thermoanaerobaculia bacterium]
MKRTVLLAAILTLLIAGWSIKAQVANDFVVIVHADNPITEISKSELSGYLLKKKTKWDNGVSVEPADLESSSDVRAALSEAVHGRTVASIKNYWQRQIFSGRGVPPKEVKSDSEMVTHVSGDAGAIGYVGPNTRLGNGVKRVRIVG